MRYFTMIGWQFASAFNCHAYLSVGRRKTHEQTISLSSQAASQDLIAKFVKAGYLRPALCNDADAVTAAIAQLKQNLRAGVTAALPDADHSRCSGLEDAPIHVPSRHYDVGDHALAGSEGAKSTLAEAAKISANPTMSATLSNSPVTSTVETTPTTGEPRTPSEAVAAGNRRTISNHIA
jgi:hypothetical protein